MANMTASAGNDAAALLVDRPHRTAMPTSNLSVAPVQRARDGSWFLPDRGAVLSGDRGACLLCHWWWPEPVDRSISPDSAAAKSSAKTTSVPAKFKNLRFRMIDNKSPQFS